MSRSSIRTRNPARARQWAAVAAFAVIFALVATLTHWSHRLHRFVPFTRLFFSDVLYMKSWLATAAVALAATQLLTAARMFEVLRFPPRGRFYNAVHRWTGRTILLLVFLIFYHCVFGYGFHGYTGRILAHSIMGSAVFGVAFAKVRLVRSPETPGWMLAIAGGLLFCLFFGLWITSGLWYLRTYGAKL